MCALAARRCLRAQGIDSAAMAFFLAWSDSPLERPPFRPRARVACRPACVRSRIRSRSNSASEANTLKMSRPCELVVSMGSLRLFRATPLSMSSCTSETKCLS